MLSGVGEGKHSRCRMNFIVATICSVFLLAAWIPSISGWSPNSVRRSLNEDAGIQTVLVVSNDGHPEHFGSVQAAVDAVPMWNYLRWVIYIKPGTYHGTVIVPEGKVRPPCIPICKPLGFSLRYYASQRCVLCSE